MSNSIANPQVANNDGKIRTRKRTSISFRRKKDSRPTTEAENSNRGARAEDQSEVVKGFYKALAQGAGRPINQRYRKLDKQGGFARYDPERPSKKHLAEAMDGSRTNEEIEALQELLMVNVCSIARRTPYPEALLWPLVATLARVIEEYLDETSEYEMDGLNFALLHLEAASGGKLRFARKGRRRQ